MSVSNRLRYDANGLNGGIVRFGILLVLFDVYLKWFRLDRLQQKVRLNLLTRQFFLLDMGVHIQYLYMLALCALEFFLSHAFARLAAWAFSSAATFGKVHGNRLTMALILSSFGKILLLVMVVWDYGNLDPSLLVSLFALMSHYCAVSVLFPSSHAYTVAILGSGMLGKFLARVIAGSFHPALREILS